MSNIKKYKLSTKEILHIVILGVIYFTWIITDSLIMKVNEFKPTVYYTLTLLLGSIAALVYTIWLHFPLIPLFSKSINFRTEEKAVALRRSYAIKSMYSIIIGFFAMSLVLIQKDQNLLTVQERGFGLLELMAAGTMCSYTIFTILYIDRIRNLIYLDKCQYMNIDVENNK